MSLQTKFKMKSFLAKNLKSTTNESDALLENHTKAVINLSAAIAKMTVVPENFDKINEMVVHAAALHDLGKCYGEIQTRIRKNRKNDIPHHMLSWAYARTFMDVSEPALCAILHHHVICEDDFKKYIKYSTDILSDKYADNMADMDSFVEAMSRFCEETHGVQLRRKNYPDYKNELVENVPIFSRISTNLTTSSFQTASETMLVRAIVTAADRTISENSKLTSLIAAGDSAAIAMSLPDFSKLYPKYNFDASHKYDRDRIRSQSAILKEMLDSDKPATALRANAGYGKTLVGLRYIMDRGKKAYWVTPQNNISRNVFKSITDELFTIGLEDCVSVALLISGTYERGDDSADIIVTNLDNFFNMSRKNIDMDKFINIMYSTVVFDEYHKFVSRDPMFAMFIQLMYTRTRYAKSHTIMMSATPPDLSMFHLGCTPNEFPGQRTYVDLVKPELFNCDTPVNFKKIFVNTMEDFSKIPVEPDTFVIIPTVEDVQKAYIAFSGANDTPADIVHARFTEDDIRQKERMLFTTHGKNSPLAGRNIIFASNLISTGLDVSAHHIYDFPLCPEDIIQKACGRASRWPGEYDYVEYTFCDCPPSPNVAKIVNENYSRELLFKLRELLKSLDDKSFTKKEVYEMYDRFYEENRLIVDKHYKEFFIDSSNALCDLKTYSVKKFQSDSHDRLSSRMSWRGMGDTIYTISRDTQNSRNDGKCDMTDFKHIVKLRISSVEFNDYEWQTEACAVRHKFLCDASQKYKNKFEDHGNRNKMRQTKETFFSYAREKDTPFLLYGARYDSKIGLVLS